MKETEKIEIMHFSQEGYVEDGKNVYETGKKMIELADKVADEGYDAVFLMVNLCIYRNSWWNRCRIFSTIWLAGSI